MRVLRQIDEHFGNGGDGAGGAAVAPHDGRAAVRADRARLELRRGRPVALAERRGPAPILLVAAVETLDAARWHALQRWSADWRLLLTSERLRALGADVAPTAVSMRPPGLLTVETLRGFAALSESPEPFDMLLRRCGDTQPASTPMHAALALARGARIAPALVTAELPSDALAALAEDEILRLSPDDVARGEHPGPALRRLSEAAVALESRDDCRLVLFGEPDSDAEHVAVIVGQPDPQRPVPVRLHSSCLTGDLLGSLRCDCGEQLRTAIDRLAVTDGVLLYLAQEGRGIGLANKLRAYRLQDAGLDTFQADRYLGFGGDLRDFAPAAAMLQALGIGCVKLLTNNPRKIEALRRAGIEVVDRVALTATPNPHNERYVAAKREQAGHYG
jgi:GTP cyclohydrolase II